MATIAENLSRIQSAKTDIRTAIEAKGVTVPSSATIDTYDDYVAQITGGIPMPSKLSSASFNDYGVITSAEIKSGVTSIGDNAFQNCSSLTSIDIPNSVTSIGDGAFQNCSSLTSIVIPDSVTTIGQYAFQGCSSLSSCTIGSGVTSIGYGAFDGCSGLTSVNINMPTVSSWFSGVNSITSITLGDCVTSIGWSAFQSCGSLTSIDIPDSVTSIGDNAFFNCGSLTSIDIPDSVTSIGYSAFQNTGIQSITIGSGVTYMGNCCLCAQNLTNGITIKAVNPPTIPNCDWIVSVPSPIYVPSGSVSAYQNDQCWSAYAAGIQPIPNS